MNCQSLLNVPLHCRNPAEFQEHVVFFKNMTLSYDRLYDAQETERIIQALSKWPITLDNSDLLLQGSKRNWKTICKVLRESCVDSLLVINLLKKEQVKIEPFLTLYLIIQYSKEGKVQSQLMLCLLALRSIEASRYL